MRRGTSARFSHDRARTVVAKHQRMGMGKTRPLPLTAWPAVELRSVPAAPRPDATLRLGQADILAADPFEARLVEVDGARFEGGIARGARVISAPRPRPAAAPPPPPPRRRREPARGKLPSYPALKIEIPPSYYDDEALVSSFRTGLLARIVALLGRLFSR